MKRTLIIAIDGPSGAGKGTVARAVADRLGYRHVDSGAMYRAVGWKALRDGVALDDEEAVAARRGDARASTSRATVVTIDGEDVTRADPDAGDRSRRGGRRAAAAVRAVLVGAQRRMGAGGGIVMEGRDIGTVVFPRRRREDLSRCAPEERARRRANDPAHTGGPARGVPRSRRCSPSATSRSHARRVAALRRRRRRRHRHDGEGDRRRSSTR